MTVPSLPSPPPPPPGFRVGGQSQQQRSQPQQQQQHELTVNTNGSAPAFRNSTSTAFSTAMPLPPFQQQQSQSASKNDNGDKPFRQPQRLLSPPSAGLADATPPLLQQQQSLRPPPPPFPANYTTTRPSPQQPLPQQFLQQQTKVSFPPPPPFAQPALPNPPLLPPVSSRSATSASPSLLGTLPPVGRPLLPVPLSHRTLPPPPPAAVGSVGRNPTSTSSSSSSMRSQPQRPPQPPPLAHPLSQQPQPQQSQQPSWPSQPQQQPQQQPYPPQSPMRPSGSVSGGYGGATGNNNNHYSQSLAPPQSPGVGGGGGYTGATMGNGSARGHVLSSVGLSGSTRNSGYPMGPPSPGLASSARGGGGGYPVGPPPLSPGLAGSTRGDVGVIGYSTGPPLPSPGARRYPEQQHMQRQYQEKPKIDPSQIPRPPLFTRPQQDSGQLPVFHPKQAATTTGSSSDGPMMSLPPPAESRYAVQDDGNASPDFIRSSVYAFPLHRGIWHQTGDIPLGIMCTPLASHAEDCVPRPRKLPDGTEQAYKDPQAVPVVGQSTYGPSSEGPPRCSHCFAYVNPFFGPGGTCNLCGHHNRNLPMTGLPVQFGTVEYDVAGPYLTRERGPVQPISLYALDLTCPDIVSYLAILEQVGLDMAEHFNRQRHFSMTGPKPAPPRIGICLVSAAGIVVLPHHNDNSPGHRYAIVSDVTVEPFAPFPLSDWTFDLSTSEGVSAWQNYVRDECTRDLVEWRRYTANFKAVSGADSLELSCGGAALQFMADALAETGGRGTWISWRRPNYGVGSLPCRDHRQQPQQQQHQADETSAYTPLQLLTDFKSRGEEVAAAFYKDLGAACAKNCVSLDVMLHTGARSPQPPLELATLGELCKVTCGKLSWISAFDWHEPLREELTRQVQSFAGWDAVFKVRCSEGIQVKSFFSSGGMLVDTTVGGSLELELSTVTPSTCIAVELEHRVGGIPKDRGLVYVQTAVLYSTQLGKRRVRVSTLAIRTTSVVNETYRSVDFSTMIALLTRSAADYIRKEPNDSASLRAKARDAVYHRCTEILANYRQHTPASTSPMGQLILPEKMQLLPLFCMCLLKSPLLRPSLPRMIPGMHASVLTPTNDERAFYNWHVGQVIPSLAMLMVHPNVFSVLNVDDTVGQWHGPDEVEQVNGFVVMPPTIGPSMESLEDDGVYLVDDGLRIFLYIGRLVAGNVKQALLEGEPTELKQLIEALVYQMRVFSSNTRGSESELRPTWVPIVRVMQQEGHQSLMEADVLNLMVADATAGEKDYVDFLCTLHRRIRERVEGGKG